MKAMLSHVHVAQLLAAVIMSGSKPVKLSLKQDNPVTVIRPYAKT